MGNSNIEKLKVERDVEGLVNALQQEDVDVWSKASAALIEIGEPAVERLILALRDANPRVRSIAAVDLGSIKDPRAVEPLINAIMTDPERDVRWHGVDSLGKIKDTRAVEPLIQIALASRESLFVREAAIQSLGEMGDTRAIEPLKKCLKEAEVLFASGSWDGKYLADYINKAIDKIRKSEEK